MWYDKKCMIGVGDIDNPGNTVNPISDISVASAVGGFIPNFIIFNYI